MSERKREQKLWDSMRSARPRRAWLQRVENGVGSGMPDLYCNLRHATASGYVSSWVELKAALLPAKESTRLMSRTKGMRKEQESWHLKAAHRGVNSGILIRDDAHHLYLIPSRHVLVVNTEPAAVLRELSVARNWPEVWSVLATKITQED